MKTRMLTPTEAMEMLTEDRDDFLEGLADCRYAFDDKYIHERWKISWHGWRPYILRYIEIGDDKSTIVLE